MKLKKNHDAWQIAVFLLSSVLQTKEYHLISEAKVVPHQFFVSVWHKLIQELAQVSLAHKKLLTIQHS